MLPNKLTLEYSRQKCLFHILDSSPFPFLVSLFLFILLVPLIFYPHDAQIIGGLLRTDLVHIGFLGPYLTAMSWFLSIVKESSQRYHTKKVQKGLRLGMILFILSEVMLFFAFFWEFFHFSLIPSVNVGEIWPPTGTQHLDVWGLPLVNTLLLLTSGLTITIAHAYIIKNNVDGFAWYLFLTILLGAVFLFCQAYEYKHGVKFSWRDNICKSIFFLTTGFYGAHATTGGALFPAAPLRRRLSTGGAGVKPVLASIAVEKPPISAYKHLLTSRRKAPGFYDEDARGLWAWYKNIGAPQPTYVWKTMGFVVGGAGYNQVWITDVTSAGLGSLVYVFTNEPSTVLCGKIIRVADPLRLVELPEGHTPERGQTVLSYTYAENIISAPGIVPVRLSLVSPPTWWQRVKRRLYRMFF